MNESQAKKIKEHLLSGKSITPLDALYQYGCFRLGARIFDLKEQGLDIKTTMIEIVFRRQEKKSCKIFNLGSVILTKKKEAR